MNVGNWAEYFGRAVARLTTAVFGQFDWHAPPWCRAAVARWNRTRLWAGIHPRAAAATLASALCAVALAYFGWRWYEARPKPLTVDVHVVAPPRTCYDCDPPQLPQPLLITFAASVAPLAAIGKPVNPQAVGLEVSPSIPGDWFWLDDRQLRFQPRADWPIGQHYGVRLPRRGLVAPHVRLATYALEFSSARFEVSIASNEFYEDPVVATDKKLVTTLSFTHPVDPASLERRVSVTVFKTVTSSLEHQLEPAPPLTITYDKLKLHAYVHTGRLPVPDKGGHAIVTVDAGVHALRGGNEMLGKLSADTSIPGLFTLSVARANLQIVRDERNEPSQALLVETTHSVTEAEISSHTRAWILPDRNPDPKLQAEWEKNNRNRPYSWFNSAEITPAVLAAAAPLELGYVPNERDHVELHSFRIKALPGQAVYLKLSQGMQSFGGYRMPEPYNSVLRVPSYPQELQIAQPGSLLALSGKRKITVFSRDVQALQIQIARLLPNQLQHLVSQSGGSLTAPQWFGNFAASDITETFTRIVNLPPLEPGQPHYEGIDLGEFLDRPGASKLGVFLLNIRAWDPKRHAPTQPIVDDTCEDCGYQARRTDTRLVLLTDLGLLVKKASDGQQELFVQSIRNGEPVADVVVEVMGRNGETILHQNSDVAGHVHFPDLKSFKREKKPILYVARRGADLTFLPIDQRAQALDLSRFDIGGVANVAEPSALTAYVFSDRGLYRPGEEIRAAAIVKAQDWRKLPTGLPIQVEITDPRGTMVRRQTLKLSESGFEEIRYSTRDVSPAGTYTVALSIQGDRDRQLQIGSLQVMVRDFLPDRLRMTTHFSAESAVGWVSPQDLKANAMLENLFGTPAAARRVTATLRLSPSFPAFHQFPDYRFRDPQTAKEGFSESLEPGTTDAQGHATFDLTLQRFARATYEVALVTEGFEADGGRGVTNSATQLVSSLPYLVGWKSDGDLAYIPRGTTRNVRLIGIDAHLQPIAVSGLTLERIERRYVSMLLKQDDGTYRYQSKLKEVSLDSASWPLAASGRVIEVATDTPGKFSYLVRDAAGQVFARIDYEVAGAANLTRSLDKNAELQITLNKKDYAPGDEIEMQIQAPYTGAGLITVERERVYAWQWFKSSTTSSIQKIRVPKDLEGNAYVQVTFVRDPASEEIYTSPLSYGIQPFSIALDARRNKVSLEAPERVKPGEPLTVRYRTEQPARVVIFAVDEGILQVANYHTPDPLGFFFAKRAHAIETRQILDLILPEFRDSMLSAPGGDRGGAIARQLNPFKRKRDPPVAWWSGIVVADASERELVYQVPGTFNGRLRLMAVAVGPNTIGTTERTATVRGDFVLSPNAPTTVAPGDEFDASVGIANNVEGSGSPAAVEVRLKTSGALQVVGTDLLNVPIGERAESSARFHVKVTDALGEATLTFTSTLPGHSSQASASVSVRPATPYATALQAGTVSNTLEVPLERQLYPQFRTLRASLSPLPLTLAHGLVSYLAHYPYSCTEQVVSQALPALVFADRPEFAADQPASDPLAGLIDELRLRQTPLGAYRYWLGGVEVVPYASVYAQALLLEVAERGRPVPKDLIASGNRYLRSLAGKTGDSLTDERVAAFATYLLARQGLAVSNEIAGLERRLSTMYAGRWEHDLTAAYIAATYELLQQHELASRTLAPLWKGVAPGDDRWSDSMEAEAGFLYLVSRHFADRLSKLPPALIPDLADHVQRGDYQSLSAAMTILALDAYARAASVQTVGNFSIAAVLKDKSRQPLPLPAGVLPSVAFPEASAALRFANESRLPGYYLVEESGFDRRPPPQALTQGLEIIREYLGPTGQPISTIKVGDEVVVRVRFRSVGRPSIPDAVLVDLLPGGFDLAMPIPATGPGGRLAATPSPAAQTAPSAPVSEQCGCAFLWTRPGGFPDYADLREDRVVLYGRATSEVQEFTYRIKATNAGRFTTPPAYGQAMYEAGIRARSVAGQLTVVTP